MMSGSLALRLAARLSLGANMRIKSLFVLLALVLSPFASHAQGGAPSSAYTRELDFSVTPRTLAASGASCNIATATAAVAAEQQPTANLSTHGIAGFLAWTTGDTVLTLSTTTSAPLGPLGYAGRVHVAFFDAGANSTPTCTRFILEGTNVRGIRVTENVAQTVTEAGSGYLSREIYQTLTRVTASGCSGFNASDEMHVRNGPWVAVPSDFKTTPVNSLIRVCMSRTGNSFRCVRGSAFTTYKTPSAARATSGTAINLLSAQFVAGSSPTNCIPDRTPVVIRYQER
jgi:hypothetical protein